MFSFEFVQEEFLRSLKLKDRLESQENTAFPREIEVLETAWKMKIFVRNNVFIQTEGLLGVLNIYQTLTAVKKQEHSIFFCSLFCSLSTFKYCHEP